MGDMDGGSGGWKDISVHTYLYLKRGFNSFSSECQPFCLIFSSFLLFFFSPFLFIGI